MTDVEFAVDYLTVWAWQKARRNSGRPDPEPDPEVQAGLERLARVIEAELAGEPSLAQLLFEAAADLEAPAVRPLTTERVRLALLNATEDDPGSAVRLHGLVSGVRIAAERVAPGHHWLTSQPQREPWSAPGPARAVVTVSVSTSTDRSIAMGSIPAPGRNHHQADAPRPGGRSSPPAPPLLPPSPSEPGRPVATRR